MRKTILSLALALVLCLGLSLPATAFDMGRVGTYTIISAGAHSGAIDQNGSLWMWGANKYGQLGNHLVCDTQYWNGNYQSVPVKILDHVVSVSCGGSHTAAIKTDGSLWMWGNDQYGQIGVGGNVDFKGNIFQLQTVPVKVMDGVAAVSCGGSHTAAIKTDGSLWMWGLSYDGQLGIGRTGNSQTEYTYQTVPVKVTDNAAAVSCGSSHTAVLKTDGSLWMWGDNGFGQLGNGETYANPDDVVKVMDGVAAVACGTDYTAAIKTDGSLWMWGNNMDGELGNGGKGNYDYGSERQTSPVKVMDGAANVSCGADHTAVIKTDGSLWMCGSNYEGQLGNGTSSEIMEGPNVPIKVLDNAVAVSCGGMCTAVLKPDGSLWTCGANFSGQLGNGGTGNFYVSRWENPCQNFMGKVMGNVRLPENTPTAPSVQSSIAYASTQTVQIDGKPIEFQMYALKDQTGNPTNYVKVRDVAYALNGTAAQFNVTWDGAVNLVSKSVYVSNGSEMSTPYTGDRAYKTVTSSTKVNGAATNLDAFTLTDDNGGGYTYYKLRDLGMALGFNVGWSAEQGIYIETNKPYQG